MRSLPAIVRAGLVTGVTAGLAGCAPTDCDPTQGGLIQGVRCDASGGFNARIKERQDQQASLLDQQMALERESQALEAERREVAARLQQKQTEQARAEQELAAVRRKLKGSQQQNAALQKQANGLEAEVARTKAEIGDLGRLDQQKKARLAELSRERQNLDQEYKAATGSR
jgi:septal ring factor EnvC (AmiA/AmiB activator)